MRSEVRNESLLRRLTLLLLLLGQWQGHLRWQRRLEAEEEVLVLHFGGNLAVGGAKDGLEVVGGGNSGFAVDDDAQTMVAVSAGLVKVVVEGGNDG